jgi:2',3'-cyclic-nucleotide 2'-phosphodiesterase (5'-nucleotidase family)
MKNSPKITAAGLRIGLITSIIVIVLLAGVGFWFFQGSLTGVATSVNSYISTAASTSEDVKQLQALKKQMDKNPIAVTRAQKIVADSQHYQYQNQIIDDITSYAKDAGFSIKGFTFTDTQPATKATVGAAAPTTAPVAPVLSGVKTTIAEIFFPETISYQAYMNFLKSIEQNLKKMEIQSISLKLNESTNQVVPDPLLIQVYIKS